MIEYKYRDKTIPMIEDKDKDKTKHKTKDQDKTIPKTKTKTNTKTGYKDKDKTIHKTKTKTKTKTNTKTEYNEDIFTQVFYHGKMKHNKENGYWRKRHIIWVFWNNNHISEQCEKRIHCDGNYACTRFDHT